LKKHLDNFLKTHTFPPFGHTNIFRHPVLFEKHY